jgi:tellurite resistance protein
VASLAWFTLHRDGIDPVAAALAGYGLLMVIAQLRLLPAYLRLSFMPSTWAFTFSWAAVASTVLIWLQETRPAAYRLEQDVVLALVTVLIAGIGTRTLWALRLGQLLPPDLSKGSGHV